MSNFETLSLENSLYQSPFVLQSLLTNECILQSSLEDGGLKPSSAALTYEHLRVLDSLTGFDDIRSPTPSVEHFMFVSERYRNTTITLESLKTRIYHFWKWFIDQLVKLGRVIKTYLQKNTADLEILENRIERISNRLDTVSNSSRNRAFTDAALAQRLCIQHKVPDNLLEPLRDFKQITKVALVESIDEFMKIQTSFRRYANENQGSIRDIMKASDLSFVGLKNVPGHLEFLNQQESKLLFGNRKLVYYTVKSQQVDEAKFAQLATGIQGKLEVVEAQRPKSDQIPIANLRDLKVILANCRDFVEDLKTFRNNIPVINRAREELIQFATTQSRTLQKSTATKSVKEKTLESLATVIPRLMYKPAFAYSSYAADTTNALVTYVHKCVIDKR